MRRSVCFTEPSTALAGERNTWKFITIPSVPLPKGTKLFFDFLSTGRIIDWERPQADSKSQSNTIWAEIEGGKLLYAKEAEGPNKGLAGFEFTLAAEVPVGKKIVIYVGSPLEGQQKEKGNACQQTVQRRRPFHLYIDPTGKRQFSDPEIFTMDIKGSELHAIKVLAPSVAVRNRRFDVVLRFEDRFGNLTNHAPEDTLIEVTHENLRDSLKWKLFLPETGFISLPNLYFNEPGVYMIGLKNLKTGQQFHSAPIKCFASEQKNIFWGTLHGESDRFDSKENIDNCLRHFRDEKSLNFFAISPPEALEETPNDAWKKMGAQISEFNEDDRFTVFLGQQWTGAPGQDGHRVFVYSKEEKPLLRSTEARTATLKKIYSTLSPKEMLSIPSFTMASNCPFDFEQFSQDFERVAEIYNAWGSSERSSKEGNPFPIKATSKNGVAEQKKGSLLQALKNNRRFGFVAGGLDDRGVFSALYEAGQKQYPPGLTAICADKQTRQGLFEALHSRQCYATTGERIVLGFFLAGSPMGSELSAAQKPGFHINRHIHGYVAGSAPLKAIEVVRNGEVIHTFTPETNFLDFEYDDMLDLAKASIPTPGSNGLFAFYYIRVTQADGHMAWSSPIWVDYAPKALKKTLPKPATAKGKDLSRAQKPARPCDEELGEEKDDDETDGNEEV